MLERMADVKRRKNDFMQSIVGDRIADIFRDGSRQLLDGHVFKKDSIEVLFDDYFTCPKTLGCIDEESLTLLGTRAAWSMKGKLVPDFFKVDALELSSSAYFEAAFAETLATHNSINTVDERLQSIDIGVTFLELAASFVPPEDTERLQRFDLKGHFADIYKDIVCGEITLDTVNDLLDSLMQSLEATVDIKDSQLARGLGGEIRALQYFWQNYHKKGGLVALPATMRGSSGRSNPEETHDIDIIKQRKDSSWVVMRPIEVKHREITDKDRARYKAILAYIAPSGIATFIHNHHTRVTQVSTSTQE